MENETLITDFMFIDFPKLEGNPRLVNRANELRAEYVYKHIGRFKEFEHKTEEQLEKMDMSMIEKEVLYTTQAAGLIRILKEEMKEDE